MLSTEKAGDSNLVSPDASSSLNAEFRRPLLDYFSFPNLFLNTNALGV